MRRSLLFWGDCPRGAVQVYGGPSGIRWGIQAQQTTQKGGPSQLNAGILIFRCNRVGLEQVIPLAPLYPFFCSARAVMCFNLIGAVCCSARYIGATRCGAFVRPTLLITC